MSFAVGLLTKVCMLTHKTKCMKLSRSSIDSPALNVCINDELINEVDSLMILGVNFSSDLRWDNQFKHLYNKCCRAISFVKRLRGNGNNGDGIWKAFVSLVLCHITFCWPVIFDLNANYFRKFEQLYRLAIRWANVSRKPSLRLVLDKCCIKLIKKISNNVSLHPLSEFFSLRETSHNVRHARVLLPMKRSSALYNRSFVKFSIYS